MGSVSWVTTPTTWPSAVGELKNPAFLLAGGDNGAAHVLLRHTLDRWGGPAHPTGRRVLLSAALESALLVLEPCDLWEGPEVLGALP